ncbi:hypothetical protein [uncultured Tenacibaculum sp.]|uniref:hypothetical protein n=1 Tax=uncultured Tenacibaculum sp. TaxID=174713 RepID=UPI00262D7649|nr:hypothetical protein [uncultured Tenacibaculum sp.]
MRSKTKIAILALIGMSLGINSQNESESYFQINADNGTGYVASRLFLKSHNDYRGAGIFSTGQTNNWFIGNPYTDHANSFMIGVTNISDGEQASAQLKYAKFYLNKDGDLGIGTTSPKSKLEIVDNTSNIGNYSDGSLQISGSNNVIGFVGQSNLNPGLNRWGIKLRENKDGDFSIHSYSTNTTRFIINSSGDVGIGTVSPSETLTLSKSGAALGIYDTNPLSKANNRIARYANSLVIQTDFSGGWKDNVNFLDNGNVGVGTRDTGTHKLAVEGSIGARKIKVEAFPNWSDFVFEKEYKLPTLKEVESHIKEKGHLKDIPSEAEVKKNGFYLGDMDAKLLQKIEELTLYTIQQDKEINELKLLVEKLLKQKNK